MKINECIEILNAVRQGKSLEWRFRGDEVWKPMSMPTLLNGSDVLLNFYEKEYRVMTDEYRAYTGVDEFVNDACNHECMLMRDTRTSRVLVPSIISDELVECGGCRIDYANLVKNYVWYDDGTSVGVKI